MAKINLPTALTKDSWFYEDNKELCEPHLGKPYLSYSTSESWQGYREDLIKKKFVGIEIPSGSYAHLGTYLGEAVETGKFGENPLGFTGEDNVDLNALRPKGAEYEKMILIDRGEYVIIGFIDVFRAEDKKAWVRDMKTGGKNKEDKYASKDYKQVVLYSYALEQQGFEIDKTDVYFIRRTGSHVKPPLNLSKEQFEIPIEYNKERVKYALEEMDRIAKEISGCYSTYTKFFS
jgi:hypothetical protein